MAKITIEDISRHTSLSRGTVSRALNDRPDISEQTKQRVLEACRKLNYVRSHAARSLATGRNYAAVAVVDDLQSPFATDFLRGVQASALKAQYAVHVIELDPLADTAADRLRALAGAQIDTVLIAAQLNEPLATIVREAMGKRPVMASQSLGDLDCDILLPDLAESGRLVARQILENGSQDVLYLHAGGPAAAKCRAGFEEFCRERGMDAGAIVVELPPDPTADLAQLEGLKTRLAAARAVGASDDLVAVQTMLWCLNTGRVPGRDVLIVGQGNERIGATIRPALTTIDWGGRELGQRAMELMLQRLGEARQDAPQTVKIAPRLVERDSTSLHTPTHH